MIVAGVGFRASASQKSLQSAYDLACEMAGLSDVDALATAAEKSAISELQRFSAARSLPLQGVIIRGILTPTQSTRILSLFGTGSVAEAAALVAAGPNARLICPRVTSRCGRVTMAIAQSQEVS